ncbi:unnamed protein product [Lactuca virosa]|uniref:Uncharacterized protein n=1 Tax=Lactuca virosa TaxID=75947 RepID=A0AAU9M7G3_9ASTR|nr:unnamed protein product [Lactuca virosa]
MSKKLVSRGNACGLEHEGTFYHCNVCSWFWIHQDRALLPAKLLIQHQKLMAHSLILIRLPVPIHFPKLIEKISSTPTIESVAWDCLFAFGYTNVINVNTMFIVIVQLQRYTMLRLYKVSKMMIILI